MRIDVTALALNDCELGGASNGAGAAPETTEENFSATDDVDAIAADVQRKLGLFLVAGDGQGYGTDATVIM